MRKSWKQEAGGWKLKKGKTIVAFSFELRGLYQLR
jgi:hypothetical protein